ncbi:MAG: ATP-binding protein [Candidatus Ornithomonoglobus sp.]
MVKRELYLKKIYPFVDKPFIKVITGLRRSGKSQLLLMLQRDFIEKGVSPEQIIYINFESYRFADITNDSQLYSYVSSHILPGKRAYIMLDEIQLVESWEKVVNSFLVDFDCDVYITGSNSTLLSGELATYIAGRYIEIQVFTLSFAETIDFYKAMNKNTENKYEMFNRFARIGGFPSLYIADFSDDDSMRIVNDITSSAILKDIVARHKIRNVALLEKIMKYIFDNIGNPFSANKISAYFKNEKRIIDIETIYNYLKYLEEAFIIYRVPRYDVRGKALLKTNEKFYLGDHALKYAMLGYNETAVSGIFENIVFLEMKRRDYSVTVGKLDSREIDFIGEKNGEKIYIQVAFRLPDNSTKEREFGNLLAINDHYPKYVVSAEELINGNINGVRHRHIADFLVMPEW